MSYNLDNVIAERKNKTVYKDGDKTIKLFCENYSKADILNEALNQARVEEGTDLYIPKLHEVTKIDGRWAIVTEHVEGKSLYELMEENPEFEVVAVNDLTDAEQLAYLLKYDTNHRNYRIDEIHADGDYIVVGERRVKVYAEKDPKDLPWKELDIDVVFESTGLFTSDEKAMAHMEAIIRSMTMQERVNPEIINSSRKQRIAKGSGTSVEEVNKLLRQFEQMKKMMKQFSDPKKLKRMGLGGRRGMKLPF